MSRISLSFISHGCLSVKASPPADRIQTLFCAHVTLTMTLIYELDLDTLKMYLHTKNELSRWRLSKVGTLQTDRHTDRRDCKQYPAAFVGGRNIHKERTALLAKCARVSHIANKRTQETG